MRRAGRSKDLAAASYSDGGRTRTLHLGGTAWVQGTMRLDRPFDIDLDYVQRMMAWLLFVEPDEVPERHALQLGLGAAAITKFCHQRLRMHTSAVEINPEVVAACRHAFHLPPDDERLQVELADAAEYLARSDIVASADAIQADLYDAQADRPVLDTPDFYAACRRALRDGGVLTVNLFGRRASLDDSLAGIAACFGPASVWVFAPTPEGNTIAVATRLREGVERDTMSRRADEIEARWGLPARRWLRSLRPLDL